MPTKESVTPEVLREKVIEFFAAKEIDIKGECYSEEDWDARGESYSRGAGLVVIHDGGCHAPYFSHDYEAYEAMEELRAFCETLGWYPEQGTSWYSGFYTC